MNPQTSAICYEELPLEVARFYLENLNKINIKRKNIIIDVDNTINYLNDMINFNGKLSINYSLSKNGNDTRLYAKRYGQQMMVRELRHSLFNNYYYDIDMVNSQPSLLYNLCLKHKYEHKYIKQLVLNRNEFYNKISENKEDAKKQVIAIINGSPSCKKNKYLKGLKKEIEMIYNKIKIDYKEIYDKKYKYVKKNEPTELWNVSGKVVHYLTTLIESELLTIVYKWFIDNNYKVGSLIYDGLMIKKDKELNQEILNELNKHIEQTTQYKNISYIIKPMDEGYKHSEEEIKPFIVERYLIKNDASGAEIILNKVKDNIILSNNNYYYRKIENTNIYKQVTEHDVKKYIKNIILNLDILLESDNSAYPPRQYSRNEPNAKKLLEATLCFIKDNEEFENLIYKSSLNKLCFLDGYFDIRDNKFKPYDNETYTLTYIKMNYPININENKDKILKEQIINKIFTDELNKKCALNYFSRGLFGQNTEKIWAIAPGVRNSGKGVITDLFRKTFNNYTDIFKGDNLLSVDRDNDDVEKQLKFIVPLKHCRLFFSNELKTTNTKNQTLKLSGSLIKSLSSGGDEQKARLLNQNEKGAFRLSGRMVLFMNDFPDCDVEDTWKTVNIIPFSSEFKESLSDIEIQNNKDPNSRIKFFVSDDNIKNLLDDIEIQQAFIKLIIESYTHKPIINNKLDNYKKDFIENKNSFSYNLNLYYEVTNNKRDYVLISEFNEIFNNMFSKSKIKQELGKICIYDTQKKIKGKNHKVYLGLRKKEENNNDNDNDNDNEPEPELIKVSKPTNLKFEKSIFADDESLTIEEL